MNGWHSNEKYVYMYVVDRSVARLVNVFVMTCPKAR